MLTINSPINHNTLVAIKSDSPSFQAVEVITVDIGEVPSITAIKTGLRLLQDYVQSNVVIERPRSMYDCSGKPFTSSIQCLKRSLTSGYNVQGLKQECIIVAVYEHDVRYDV